MLATCIVPGKALAQTSRALGAEILRGRFRSPPEAGRPKKQGCTQRPIKKKKKKVVQIPHFIGVLALIFQLAVSVLRAWSIFSRSEK